MAMWWKDSGFAEAPQYVILEAGTALYRVCGGPTNLAFGSYYMFDEPTTASAAERQLNIVKWGNLCYYWVQFEVIVPTGVHVGRIAQDFGTDRDAGGKDSIVWVAGRRLQAYLPVDKARRHLRLVGSARRLVQDVSVVIPRQRLDA